MNLIEHRISPYNTTFPGLGGVLKTEPKDFVVEEIPTYLPCGEGEHLFLWIENDHSDAVVIEAKWTDWDKLDAHGTLRRNLAAHRRQVLSYVDGEIWTDGSSSGDLVMLENISRQAGLIYPKTPDSKEAKTAVER